LISGVQRGIARLIDAYQEGFLERTEFEPRIRAARERLARLESEAEALAGREIEEGEMRRVVDQLESFAARVRDGLETADWDARREIMRALIRKVEIGEGAIRIEYKVGPLPFDRGPSGPSSQHCGRGDDPPLRCTLRGGEDDVLLQVTGLQPLPEDLRVHGDMVDQPSVADLVERLSDMMAPSRTRLRSIPK
jgi:site-specific DNA recombinase